MKIALSTVLFIIAGLLEIGGGYLVWQWLREGKAYWYAVLGAVFLMLYGIVPTIQPESAFGRIYAAYGGVFVAMSLLWGIVFYGWRPDRFDVIGASLCVVGVSVIMWAPRG